MRIIGEYSSFRTTWDILLVILIVVSILYIPYQFVFQYELIFLGSAIVYAIDLFFIAHIYSNSNTSVHFAGRENRKGTTLRKHYLKSDFKIEFTSALPIDLIFILWPGFEFLETMNKMSSEKPEKITDLLLEGSYYK